LAGELSACQLQLPRFSFFWVLAFYALILALTLPGKPKVRNFTLRPAVPILDCLRVHFGLVRAAKHRMASCLCVCSLAREAGSPPAHRGGRFVLVAVRLEQARWLSI
jgi:hypothetical protein